MLKVQLGEIIIECSTDEFRAFYPLLKKLMNNNSSTEKQGKTKGQYRNNYQTVLEEMTCDPSRMWTIKELSRRTGIKPKTVWKQLARMVREERVEHEGKGRYQFVGAECPSDGHNDKYSTLKISSKGNVNSVSTDMVNDMFRTIKPMFAISESCSEMQIKKHFKKLPSSVIEAFLSEAIKKGLLKEHLGIYTLVNS